MRQPATQTLQHAVFASQHHSGLKFEFKWELERSLLDLPELNLSLVVAPQLLMQASQFRD
jgi:hypothetical protein